MTTLRKTIENAFRESGIIAADETPDANQTAEALDRLNRLIKSLFGNEFGENLLSVNYGTSGIVNPYGLAEDDSDNIDSIYVPTNTRLILNINTGATLYLPPNPKDGARFGIVDNGGTLATSNVIINGNGRRVEDAASVVLNTNSLKREWFYRADLANWVRVTDLDIGNELPWPEEFDDLLVTLLAFRLNPRYGAETSQNLVTILSEMRKKFRARYQQTKEMQIEDGIVILPLNPFSRKNLIF